MQGEAGVEGVGVGLLYVSALLGVEAWLYCSPALKNYYKTSHRVAESTSI